MVEANVYMKRENKAKEKEEAIVKVYESGIFTIKHENARPEVIIKATVVSIKSAKYSGGWAERERERERPRKQRNIIAEKVM